MKRNIMNIRDEALEHRKRQREEKEKNEKRDDRDQTAEVWREHTELKARVDTSTPEKRYAEIMQAAERKVRQNLEKLETRLAKREAEAANRLNAIMAKRPGRVAKLLTRGKAAKKWDAAVKKQKATLFQIRKRNSTAFSIRTQSSHYRREIDGWIRNRAMRIDKPFILEFEKQERLRREIEAKSIEVAREMEKQRERNKTREMGVKQEVRRENSLERTFAVYP